MGADGHIAIYDWEKVEKIIAEINTKAGNEKQKVYWWGYVCDWQCNGKKACIEYWGDNLFDSQFELAKEIWVTKDDPSYANYSEREGLFTELYERCQKEAVLVRDQEVWT